jgi:hypothetical protein
VKKRRIGKGGDKKRCWKRKEERGA